MEERVLRLLRRVCSGQRALPWPPWRAEAKARWRERSRKAASPAPGAQGEAIDRLQGGPWGRYLGSACSALGAAPHHAPATRGQSGPGRAPRWGGGREQGGACVSRTLLSGSKIHLCLPPGPRAYSCLSPTPLVALFLSQSSLSVTIYHSDSVSLEPGPPLLPSLSS